MNSRPDPKAFDPRLSVWRVPAAIETIATVVVVAVVVAVVVVVVVVVVVAVGG